MKLTRIILPTLLFALIFAYILFALLHVKKTAYVDNAYLFENFNMKTELYKKLKEAQEVRKGVLDSLEQKLKQAEQQLNGGSSNAALLEAYKMQKQQYVQKSQGFSEEMDVLKEQTDDQIWQKINSSIMDYGKTKKYTYIFGANGQGSLMYAEEEEAITKDVLEYINNAYEGKNK